jgi:hypothetical protein
MRMKKSLSLFLFFFSILYTVDSYACSSCGSSATSPLVLNQDENLKLYFGLSENYNYMNYGMLPDASDTKRWVDPMITTKSILTMAAGYRTSENSFVTLTGSAVKNVGPADANDFTTGTKTRYLLGDPIISGRYNVVNMNIDSKYRPQVQLIASYKPSLAKNMVDNPNDDAIDTTGNGFHQVSGGVDLWWGMPYIQFGASQFVTYSFTRNPNNNFGVDTTQTKRTRDLQYTTVLTVGHNFKDNNFALQGGLILDHIGQEKIYIQDNTTGATDVLVEGGGAAQSNSVFAVLNWNLTHDDMVRFSYTYGGAYNGNLGPYTNSNQTTSSMVLVAYERTLY